MTTLIFSCNTGEGHNSAARAIKEVYDRHGRECMVVDALSVFSDKTSGIICGGHTALYRRMPGLFGVGYRFFEKKAEKENSIICEAFAKGARSLYELIRQNKCEVVISTHPFAALMLARIKKVMDHGLTMGFVATDYTCSPFVSRCGADLYFIPHESLRDEFIAKGVEDTKVIPSGIPVSGKFRMELPKGETRRALGIPENGTVCLLMCGSMGCGPMRVLATRLGERFRADQTLVVICGTNTRLQKQLAAENKKENVRIIGFTKKMHMYMAAADLAITKGGGLTLTEGANSRLPMAVMDTVSGCETYNVKFFTENKLAVTAPDTREMMGFIMSLLDNRKKLDELSLRLAAFFPDDAGEIIYKHMCGNGTMQNDRLQKIPAVQA